MVICGGRPINGCDPISGPFPIGTEENDLISYGYDMRVRPFIFDSQMGMVMIDLSLQAQPADSSRASTAAQVGHCPHNEFIGQQCGSGDCPHVD